MMTAHCGEAPVLVSILRLRYCADCAGLAAILNAAAPNVRAVIDATKLS
jgi:hypothetical protein